MDTAKELAAKLAMIRLEAEVAQGSEDMAMDIVRELPEYKEWLAIREKRNQLVVDQIDLEVRLRNQMIAEYKETGEKKFDGIGQVIDTRTVDIYDPIAAFAWAKERGVCLKLDEAALKKVAGTLDPDGVRIELGNAGRINRDLSGLITSDGAEPEIPF